MRVAIPPSNADPFRDHTPGICAKITRGDEC
jgi:hypothetical protein